MTHPSIHARNNPDKIAYQMAATGKAITYRELDELSNQGAQLFRALGLKAGDHVALCYPSCGVCAPCVERAWAYCAESAPLKRGGTRRDGSIVLRHGAEAVHGNFFQQSSFATHALATERNAIKVRAGAPLELLGPFGCGLNTGAGTVLNVLRPRPGAALAVFGALDVPLVYFSIWFFRTQHPQPVVGGGGSIDPRMLRVLLINWLAFLCFAFLVCWSRFRLELLKREVEQAHAMESLAGAGDSEKASLPLSRSSR